MFFAKYMTGARVGKFTEGKVYLVSDPLERRSAAGDSFNVEDDQGAKFLFKRDDGHFEFPAEAHVCCVKPVGDFKLGEVLLIDSADDTSFKVVGYGWMQAGNFEIVDASNFSAGSYVQDDGNVWRPVLDIKPDMTVLVDRKWQSLDSFRLPIADGSVSTVPLAKCVDAVAEPRLVVGREYLIVWEDNTRGTIGIDMEGLPQAFDATRFTKN
jgi:hypothetical protein